MGERHEREPEWSEEDLEMMQALDAYEGGLNAYGIPIDEATDPMADPGRRDGTHTYVAEPVIDWSQLAVEKARTAKNLKDDPLAPGYRFTVRRVERTTTQ